MSQPYTAAQKFEVVSFVNTYNADHGKGGQNEAARRFKLSPLTISAWLKAASSSSQSLISNPRSPISSDVEIVTASQVDAAELAGLAESISRSREIIHKHEQACHETTLEHYLDAGQQLARAQEIFTLSNSERASLGGEAKSALSTVDKAQSTSPEILAIRGFSAWLADALPDLKRPTAIRYATAYRSLGLPLTAKPAEIRAKVKTLRHQAQKAGLPMPTLASVLKTAPKPEKPALINPVPFTMSPEQLALEDAREAFHLWREAFEKLLRQGSLEDLDKPGLLELKEFAATVRDRVNARLK